MKPTIKIELVAILFLAISCTKESTQTSSSASTQSGENSLDADYMGQHYGGGIVFYRQAQASMA